MSTGTGIRMEIYCLKKYQQLSEQTFRKLIVKRLGFGPLSLKQYQLCFAYFSLIRVIPSLPSVRVVPIDSVGEVIIRRFAHTDAVRAILECHPTERHVVSKERGQDDETPHLFHSFEYKVKKIALCVGHCCRREVAKTVYRR